MPEIIPKTGPKFPIWFNILLYLAVGLLLVCLLVLFTLFRFEKKASQVLEDLEDSLLQRSPVQQDLEKEVFGAQEKIDNFAKLLNVHYAPLNFFTVLEGICHPQVQFTDIDLNVPEAKVGLSGNSASFSALGQQLAIFAQSAEIKSVRLTKIALRREGGAEFGISLTFDPGIFK